MSEIVLKNIVVFWLGHEFGEIFEQICGNCDDALYGGNSLCNCNLINDEIKNQDKHVIWLRNMIKMVKSKLTKWAEQKADNNYELVNTIFRHSTHWVFFDDKDECDNMLVFQTLIVCTYESKEK